MPVYVMRCLTMPSRPVICRLPCHPLPTNVSWYQGGRAHMEHTRRRCGHVDRPMSMVVISGVLDCGSRPAVGGGRARDGRSTPVVSALLAHSRAEEDRGSRALPGNSHRYRQLHLSRAHADTPRRTETASSGERAQRLPPLAPPTQASLDLPVTVAGVTLRAARRRLTGAVFTLGHCSCNGFLNLCPDLGRRSLNCGFAVCCGREWVLVGSPWCRRSANCREEGIRCSRCLVSRSSCAFASTLRHCFRLRHAGQAPVPCQNPSHGL